MTPAYRLQERLSPPDSAAQLQIEPCSESRQYSIWIKMTRVNSLTLTCAVAHSGEDTARTSSINSAKKCRVWGTHVAIKWQAGVGEEESTTAKSGNASWLARKLGSEQGQAVSAKRMNLNMPAVGIEANRLSVVITSKLGQRHHTIICLVMN